MNYNARFITTNTNCRIAQGRRCVGGGSRQRTFQHLIRTNMDTFQKKMANLRAVFRNGSTRSRCQVTQQGKWFLQTSQAGISANYEIIQYFAGVLHKHEGTIPATSRVEEFITFLLGNNDLTSQIGTNLSKEPEKTVVEEEEPPKVEQGWDTQSEFGCAARTARKPREEDWGDDWGNGGEKWDDEEE